MKSDTIGVYYASIPINAYMYTDSDVPLKRAPPETRLLHDRHWPDPHCTSLLKPE